MRRRSIALILALAAAVWPAAVSSAHGVTAAQPVGSLQADFNDDGVADLGAGAPFEDVGATHDAGAVNVLYGSADKLSGTGSQLFWHAAGAAGSAEAEDLFGFAFVGSDQSPSPSASSLRAQSEAPATAPSGR